LNEGNLVISVMPTVRAITMSEGDPDSRKDTPENVSLPTTDKLDC